MASGRFAPSPTGPLHLGNLRTAVAAWLLARSTSSRFVMRVEDLDPSTRTGVHVARQLADIASLGIDWDGPETYQSHPARLAAYADAIQRLVDEGHTYCCYCSRREVRAATLAAHGSSVAYPGTCRDLSPAGQAAAEALGRPAALRLRGRGNERTFVDGIAGKYTGPVDDVVVRRNDGTPAYNLAVVVDDAAQGVEEVVRGDDLLASTPAQLEIADLLGYPLPSHAHVPLAYGPAGDRLAKRDGAVTLGDLSDKGIGARQVLSMIGHSLRLSEPGEEVSVDDLLMRFQEGWCKWEEWHLTASDILSDDAGAP